MHVDWDWIKQRPHFIAEKLANHFDLLICYPFSRKRSLLVKNNRQNLKFCPFVSIPFRQKNRALYYFNNFILSIFFKMVLFWFKPDFIWITSPELLPYVLSSKSKLIYDCMDDVCEFHHSPVFRDVLENLEKNLLQRSSLVFASSKQLINVMNSRIKCLEKICLIRNAFGGDILPVQVSSPSNVHTIYKIGYIGTISSWFDYDAINYCLERIHNIEIHLIGPIEVEAAKKSHERIYFHGAIKHRNLFNYCKDFDCLILPFKLNKLIRSVDPVKLYEYINFNKPIASIYYEEIDRFSPFVYFYNDQEALCKVLISLITQGFPKKYTDQERQKFLQENSWDTRIKEIIQHLECLT